MAKVITTITDAQKDLAARIRTMCLPINGPDADLKAATEAQHEASEIVKNSGRLAIARTIAEASHTEAWRGNDIAVACEYARSMGNDKTAKTLNTVISEMRLFANPNIRADVGALADACQQAWDEEAMEIACADPEDRKNVPTPVRNYAPRVYHLLCSITRAVKDGNLTVYNSANIVWWAKVNDPAMDPEKTLAKVKSIIKQLDTIRALYSVADLDAACDVLRTVDEKALEAGLTRPVHVKPGASVPPPAPAPEPITPVYTPVVTPELVATVEDTDEGDGARDVDVAEGAYDLDVEGMMNDNVRQLHALAAD